MKSADQNTITTASRTDLKFTFGKPGYPNVTGMYHSSFRHINNSADTTSVVCRSMRKYHLLLWIIFVFCTIECSLGEILIKPLNRAAVKGEKVQLNCSVEGKWNAVWQIVNPLQPTRELTMRKVILDTAQQLYSFEDVAKGRFNLIFNAAEITSGKYICDEITSTQSYSAQVIVLDAQPKCSKKVTNGAVKATCSIDFYGNWAPEIEWQSVNGRLPTNDTTTIPNRRVTNSLIVSRKDAESGIVDTLTCTIKFTIKNNPGDTTATNVPEFSSICKPTVGSSGDAPSMQEVSPPPSSSAFAILHDWHSLRLCLCLAGLAFLGMLSSEEAPSMQEVSPPPSSSAFGILHMAFLGMLSSGCAND